MRCLVKYATHLYLYMTVLRLMKPSHNPLTAYIKVLNLHSSSIGDWSCDVCIDTTMLRLANISVILLCFTLSHGVKSHLQGQFHFIKHSVHPRAIAISPEWNINAWAEWRPSRRWTRTIARKVLCAFYMDLSSRFLLCFVVPVVGFRSFGLLSAPNRLKRIMSGETVHQRFGKICATDLIPQQAHWHKYTRRVAAIT